MKTTEQNNAGDTTANKNTIAGLGQDFTAWINSVKREVFTEFQTALGANDQLLRLALIEADALARQTEYPHLLFPVLAAEKAGRAARWQFHQQFLLRSNDALAA